MCVFLIVWNDNSRKFDSDVCKLWPEIPIGLYKACMPKCIGLMQWNQVKAIETYTPRMNLEREPSQPRSKIEYIYKYRRAASPKTFSEKMIRYCNVMCNNFYSPSSALYHSQVLTSVFCCGIFLFPNWLSMISKCAPISTYFTLYRICVVCVHLLGNEIIWLVGNWAHTWVVHHHVCSLGAIGSPHTHTHSHYYTIAFNECDWHWISEGEWIFHGKEFLISPYCIILYNI